MRKKQRTLIGCLATSLCFFASTLSGSFAELTTEQTMNTTNLTKINQVDTSTKETPTPTITVAPTLTPTPTSTPTPTLTPTVTPTPEPTLTEYTLNFTIPNITVNLNIRSGPSTNTDIIGKLPPQSFAYILGTQNDWVKISTGSIDSGYISATYLFSEEEIKELCDKNKWVSATVTVEVLNVRSGPSTNTDILSKLKKGEKVTVLLSKSFNEWLAIQLDDNTIGYISSEYATVSCNLQTGYSLEELEEQKKQEAEAKAKEQEAKAKKEAEEKAKAAQKKAEEALAKARVTTVSETTRNPISMTEDELFLFATVIYTEAANQQYEGMLAVANVILNRMESKKWGTTLEEVLFAPGQFTGATQPYLEKAWSRGIPDICYKAAKEALAGRNNIGDFLYFRKASGADLSSYKKFYILEDHVFYERK